MKLKEIRTQLAQLSALTSVLAVLMLAGCGSGGGGTEPPPPPPPPPPAPCGALGANDTCESIQVGGFAERNFLLHEPANRMDLAPIVFFLHGGGGISSPASIDQLTGAKIYSDDSGYLAVMPVGSGDWGWSSEIAASADISEDSQLISAIVDQLVANNMADPDRVYAVGYSGGSHMVYQLACEVPDKINAVVGISGQIRGDIEACNAGFPVAIHHIHGSDDNDTPVGGANNIPSVDETLTHWRQINSCDGTSDDSAEFGLTVTHQSVTTTYNGCTLPLKYTQINGGDHYHQFNTGRLHELLEDFFQ